MPNRITQSNPAELDPGLENHQPRSWKRSALLFLLALPALWVGWLIFRYGVDVPFLDEWECVYPLLEKQEAGTLGFSDFFAIHNVHRMVFPRLFLFGLARLTDWNIRAELLFTWLLTGVIAVNLWRLAWLTSAESRQPVYGGILLAYVLLFTPLKMEIWVNGMEMQFTLAAACLTACLWIAPAVRFPLNYLLTMVLSAVATFSLAAGLLCWVLTFPLLLRQPDGLAARGKTRWIVVWVLAFLLCFLLSLPGTSRPSADSSLTAFLFHPFAAVGFLLAYLGGGFGFGTALAPADQAQAAGVVLVLLTTTVAGYVWRFRRDEQLVFRTLPWLLLAAYALLNAALTMVGRLELGTFQALSSRYLDCSLLLPVSLLFLVPAVWQHWRAGAANAPATAMIGTGLVVVATVLALLHGLGSASKHKRPEANRPDPPPGHEAWHVTQHDRLMMKSLFLLINVVDEPETLTRITLLEDPSQLKARVNLLNRLGYIRPRLIQTPAVRGLVGATRRPPREFGEIQQVRKPADGQLLVAGWAVLPDKRRPADMVLLTYDNPQGDPMLFALATVEEPRLDLTASDQSPRHLRKSGWVKAFSLQRLPANARVVRAWAFDAETARIYPIHGNVNVVAAPAS